MLPPLACRQVCGAYYWLMIEWSMWEGPAIVSDFISGKADLVAIRKHTVQVQSHLSSSMEAKIIEYITQTDTPLKLKLTSINNCT